jgi:hypothetical protein
MCTSVKEHALCEHHGDEGLLLLYKDMLFHTGVDAATLMPGGLQLSAYQYQPDSRRVHVYHG